MSYGLLKSHHGIMKSTALEDYEAVSKLYAETGKIAIEPKGKHWHKVENATAAMVKELPDCDVYLNRGLKYYKSL